MVDKVGITLYILSQEGLGSCNHWLGLTIAAGCSVLRRSQGVHRRPVFVERRIRHDTTLGNDRPVPLRIHFATILIQIGDLAMKTLSAFVIAALAWASAGWAEPFPAQEIWHLDLDRPTVLGPSWVQDGQAQFLVGYSDRVAIVSRGQAFWTSPALGGEITALARIDFGIGDGPEIIAGVMDDSTGRLVVFKGEQYGDMSRVELFGIDTSYDGIGDFAVISDLRRITTITTFEDQLPDSSKNLVIFTQARVWETGLPIFDTFGQVILYSLAHEEATIAARTWFTNGCEQFDWNGDGSNELIFQGSDIWMNNDLLIIDEAHALIVLDQALGPVVHWDAPTLVSYVHPTANRAPMVKLDWGGIHNCVAIAYPWGDNEDGRPDNVAIIEPGEFEPRMSVQVPTGELNSLAIQHSQAGGDRMVCFYNNGAVWAAPADSLANQHQYQSFGPIIHAEIGDFEADGGSQMAILQADGLHFYTMGDLAAPSAGSPALPQTVRLLPPFPNPFNSITTISYSLAHPGYVRLGVYDALGRRVTLLRDGYAAAGTMREVWRADGMPAGEYLLELRTGETGVTRGVVIVK